MKLADLFVKYGKSPDLHNYGALQGLETARLLALMRHEAHRIEKTIYNNILEKKYDIYLEKRVRIGHIIEILKERGVSVEEPTVAWAQQIHDAFDNLNESFIKPNSLPPRPFEPQRVLEFVDFARARRSVRVWSDEQPSPEELEALAYQLIDAARWAPSSGNRQPWRFKILIEHEKKKLLRGLKEQHCISAPLLIFLGMDVRVYGGLGKGEKSIFVDAGAAGMQMVLAAHQGGYGVCWNHFAIDLIESRKSNIEAYKRFSQKLGIDDWITPIAIIAIGRPAFLPPVPARSDIESLLIPDPS